MSAADEPGNAQTPSLVQAWPPWLLVCVCLAGVLAAAGLSVLYALLPADGGTGDLGSFEPGGFRVQWMLDERPGGLRPGDVIVRAGGLSLEEWLARPSGGAAWLAGGIVLYEIQRDGRPLVLRIRPRPVAFVSVLRRWAVQIAIALALLLIGAFVIVQRGGDLAARQLAFFCFFAALQYWGDGYNLQFSSIPLRWPFWFHVVYEHITYSFAVSSLCHFALVFPVMRPVVRRHRRLTPVLVFVVPVVIIALTMLLSGSVTAAITNGNQVSWFTAVGLIAITLVAAVVSSRSARDPVSRAQIRWITWYTAVCGLVLFPLYVLPIVLGRAPLLPHPGLMVFIAVIPLGLAVAILRYRLFDLDIIIHRSLVYGALTVLLMGLYLVLVPLLTFAFQRLFNRGDDTVVVFLATLSIAMAFFPLRRRVQRLIDRTFYRTRLDPQKLLPEMSERLASSIEPTELARLLTEEIPKRCQIAWATLAVSDAEGDVYGYVTGDERLPASHPLVAHLRRAGIVLRLRPAPGVPAGASEYVERSRIELAIPLRVGQELVGLYNLGPKLSGDAYDRDEIRFFELLSKQAAMAVQNARLFRAERNQRELAQALDSAAAVVIGTLDLEQVLDRILEQVERVLGGDAFNIMLIDDGRARVVRSRGYQRLGVLAMEGMTVAVEELPSLRELIRVGKPVVVRDTGSAGALAPPPTMGWLRSYVCAPIRIAGSTVGALNVDGLRVNQFELSDGVRLEAFTHHAATAIRNARLYQQAQHEIAERSRTEERIRVSLEEKEVLLREVHHRVKNNLQIISSLLYLQSRRIGDPGVEEIFRASQSRVRSMAFVHEKLYQSHDLSRIDLGQYVESLARDVYLSYTVAPERVALEVHIERVLLSVDLAVPCGLVLSELLTNALKHAFPGRRRGSVWVGATTEPSGLVTLVFRDNGVGMPAAFDPASSASLGLELVRRLVAQLEGTIDLDRTTGTSWTITFRNPAVPAAG
jgi:two-component sensor histidine kinase